VYPYYYCAPYPFYGFGTVVTEVIAAPVVVPQPVYYPAPVAVAAAPGAPLPLPAPAVQAPAEQVAPPAVERPAPPPEMPGPAPATPEQPAPAAEPQPPAAEDRPSETAAPAEEPATQEPSASEAAPEAPTTQPAISEEFIRQMNTGAEAFANGKYDDARRAFAAAMTEEPDNLDARLAYAIAHFAMTDYPAAARTLREVIPANPLIVHSPFDLRQQYKNADELTRQVAKLQDYIAVHPQDVDGLVVLGFVQHFSGGREDARKTFAEVQRRSPDDAVAKAFLNPPPLPQATTQPAAATTQPSATPTAPATAAPTTRPAEAVR